MASTSFVLKPQIAILVRVMEGGGAQKDAVLLAGALFDRGWRVSILTLQAQGALAALVAPGVEVVQLPSRSLKTSVAAFRRAFARFGPQDLLLSSEAAQNVVAFAAHATLARIGRPKLLLREVTSPSLARTSDPYIQNRLAYRVIGAAYARCDRTLTLTDGARTDLIQNFGVPAANIEVMRANAVLDAATVRRMHGADLEAGREAGLVVSVGRLSPEKDQLTLVQAFAKLPPGYPARLVLVGEGPSRSAIEQTVARLGLSESVTLAGFYPDPFVWLRRAELCVCSSRFEGFGNALIEALAMGTPVVSTDSPFGPREILRDGQFGGLVPVQNPVALASAIQASLGAPVDRSALQARSLDFTAEAAAIEFERIAKGLAAQRLD